MDAIPGAVAQLTEVAFYYLRHGETDWNRDRLCQGHTDIPLNETGRSQAESAKVRLQDCEIATICCSPLARARETAEIVNQALGHPGPVLIVGHGGVYWSLQRHGGFDTEGTSLPNAVPVWHQPPTTNDPSWQTQILE